MYGSAQPPSSKPMRVRRLIDRSHHTPIARVCLAAALGGACIGHPASAQAFCGASDTRARAASATVPAPAVAKCAGSGHACPIAGRSPGRTRQNGRLGRGGICAANRRWIAWRTRGRGDVPARDRSGSGERDALRRVPSHARASRAVACLGGAGARAFSGDGPRGAHGSPRYSGPRRRRAHCQKNDGRGDTADPDAAPADPVPCRGAVRGRHLGDRASDGHRPAPADRPDSANVRTWRAADSARMLARTDVPTMLGGDSAPRHRGYLRCISRSKSTAHGCTSSATA